MPLLPSHTLLQVYNLTLLASSYLLLFSPLSFLNASPLWLLGESMHIRRASFVPATPNLGNNPSASAPGVVLHSKKSLVQSILGNSSLLSNDIREVLALLAVAVFVAAITQGILVTPLRYSKDNLIALAQKGRSSRHGNYTDDNAASEFAEKVHTVHTAQTQFLTLSALRVVVEGSLVAYIYLVYSDRSHKLGDKLDAIGDYNGVMSFLANRIVFAIAMGDMLFWGYLWTVLREEVRDIAEVLSRRKKMEEDDRE